MANQRVELPQLTIRAWVNGAHMRVGVASPLHPLHDGKATYVLSDAEVIVGMHALRQGPSLRAPALEANAAAERLLEKLNSGSVTLRGRFASVENALDALRDPGAWQAALGRTARITVEAPAPRAGRNRSQSAHRANPSNPVALKSASDHGELRRGAAAAPAQRQASSTTAPAVGGYPTHGHRAADKTNVREGARSRAVA